MFSLGVRAKLLIFVLLPVCLIFSGIEYLNYGTGKSALESEIKERAMNMLDAYTLKLNGEIEKLQDIAEGLAVSLETMNRITETELRRLIQNFLKMEPNAYGSAVAFEPGAFSPNSELVGIYYYRANGGFEYVDLASPSYNYPDWDWYKVPAATREPLWIEPYRDSGGGNVVMTTFSRPFFKDEKVWGIATVDVAISKLTEIVDNIKVGQSGFAFLISRNGTFLSSRRSGFSKSTIFDTAKQFDSSGLNELGKQMTEGNAGYMSFVNPIDGQLSWFAYAPIPSTGWSLAIVFPEDELMSELVSLHRRILILSIFGLLLISGIVFYISGRISSPIKTLSEAARRISSGSFNLKIPARRSNDEVGVLTSAFADMSDSLEEKIEHIIEEKEMFKIALSHLTEGVLILNARWNVLQSNDAAQKLLKLPAKNTLLEHLGSIFDSTIPFVELSNESREHASFQLVPKGGGARLSCTVAPLYGEGNKIKERVLTVSLAAKI